MGRGRERARNSPLKPLRALYTAPYWTGLPRTGLTDRSSRATSMKVPAFFYIYINGYRLTAPGKLAQCGAVTIQLPPLISNITRRSRGRLDASRDPFHVCALPRYRTSFAACYFFSPSITFHVKVARRMCICSSPPFNY
jgi:hypothetical protein